MELNVDIEKKLGDMTLRCRFNTGEGRFALLGASGCGKTTTLRLIAGIMTPDRGRITLGDRVLFDSEKKINIPARKRSIGYLFQDHALFPNMTAYQNIMCRAKDRDYAESLIEKFDLQGVKDRYPSRLSGGESQRTAIARMLSTKPEMILLDEPFCSLDNYLKTVAEREIAGVLDEFEGPAMLVSHDRNEVYRFADTIGVMENGSVTAVLSKKEFFDLPGSAYSARLTGCKNISALQTEGGTVRACDWGITLGTAESLSLSGDMRYAGYRAHFFDFVRTEDAAADDDAHIIECETVRVTEDAFSMIVLFRSKGNTSSSRDSLMTWITGTEKWQAAEKEVMSGRFFLRWKRERMMFFDR